MQATYTAMSQHSGRALLYILHVNLKMHEDGRL